MAGNISGINSSSEPIIIKTKNGTFSVEESLFESYDKGTNSVTLTNGDKITMGEDCPDGKVTVKDTGDIQIFPDGTDVYIDAQNGADDNLCVEATRSRVVISAENRDKVFTRTIDGRDSSIIFGDKSVFAPTVFNAITQAARDPFVLADKILNETKELGKGADNIAQKVDEAEKQVNILLANLFNEQAKGSAVVSAKDLIRQADVEPEDQTEANEIKKYDELVKNFGNKNCSEEEYNEIYWLSTKYGFISPAVAIYEKDEAAVANYNALMHKYYETKKLNLDETVEVNLISQEYNTLLPLELKTIVPDDSIRSLGFMRSLFK